ncbi:MAG TPA: DegQ family serine endoprotease [Lacunisphaera sp.]|jgi:serine protease Do
MKTTLFDFLRRRFALSACLVALAGLMAGAAGAAGSSSPLVIKRDNQTVARGQMEKASYADIVKRVSPSVVKITSEIKAKRVKMNGGENQMFEDPMLRQFFGGHMPEMQSPAETGLGSGVIISSDGYIATNNHVVDGADQLTVTLEDGRELRAKVVGRDPLTDIAVVKVDAKDLPAVTFADTNKIEVGDRVLAIGNPFGIGETVTSGIVSGKGRRVGILSDVKGFENFIQTDAAINPGNSGGALIDIDGRVIGINTAILSRSGGFQGVGLAVPANLVSQVAESLVKSGKVVRGFLGVNVQDITPALADSFGLKSRAGALVAEVTPDSPAAKAGVKEGDVITQFNGAPVVDANGLTFQVTAVAPDTKVNLEVLRDGKSETLAATTGKRPGAGHTSEVASTDDEGVLNGVAVEDLTPDARREMHLPSRLKGAVVSEVAPDSASARAGLSAGDVILEINRQRVTSAEDAINLSSKAENKKTLLKLWSHGATIFVVVDETDSAKGDS